MGSQRAHERIQKTLVERLKDIGYSKIYQNQEYHVSICGHYHHGEVDVLAISPRGYLHFYEVKSGKGKKTRAQNQFDRYKFTHPHLDVKGVFVSPYGIGRLE